MKRLVSFIAVLMAVLTLAAPAISAAELVDMPAQEADSADSLDFSTPESPRAYLSPSDLLGLLLTDGMTEVEADYADGYFDKYLSYASALPAYLLSTEEAEGSIRVSADSYSYMANNGQTVTYIPAYLKVGQTRYELTRNGDSHTALIPSGSESVRVYYNGYLPISASDINELLNFTYNEAMSAMSAAAYLAEYHRALTEYESYLEILRIYEGDKAEYDSYLSAKALYDKALADYEKNQEDIRTYPERLKKYEDHKKALSKYTADMEIYKADYAKYESAAEEHREYITNLSAIRSAIAPMESLFTKPSRTGTLFNALQNGELVEMIEKYQGLLISGFGVRAEDIKYLRQYSDELNALLRGYAEAREISEEAAFAYYKTNYARISALFNSLYDKMSGIITPTIFNLICKKMELEYGKEFGEYRKWRIKNVLCHIYLICLCLDDSQTADGKWKFYEDDGDPWEYHFSELLEQCLIITDTNASDPSSLSWVAPVELPTVPTLPVSPEAVAEPVEPMELPKPTPPAALTEPKRPEAVEKPLTPEGIDRELLQRAGDIVALVGGESPSLCLREEVTEPVLVPTELSVERLISPKKPITVYDREGELTGDADSLSELTAKQSDTDGRGVYTFTGNWSLSPIEYIPLPEDVSEGISVYPIYTRKRAEYTVTFSVNGKETAASYPVGELPDSSDIDTHRESDSMYDYTFEGWDKAIRRVEGDVTYTANYSESDRIFTVSFVMHGQTLVKKYLRDSTIADAPIPPESYIEGASLFELAETVWDKPITNVTEDVTYTALYTEVPLAGGADPTVSEGIGEYILSGSGRELELSGLLSLSAGRALGMTVRFEDVGVSLTLSPSAVSSLSAGGALKIELIGSADEGFGFVLTDGEGSAVEPAGSMRLSLAHGYEDDSSIYVRAYYKNGLYSDNVANSCEGGICHLRPTSEVRYKVFKRFSLTVRSGENGSAFIEGVSFAEGEDIALTVNPNSQYKVGRVTLKDLKSGETVELSSYGELKMPDFDAELFVEFVPVIYNITFEYSGRRDTYGYLLGQEPAVPDITLSFVKDGYLYTFIGWSSPVSIVSKDVTYTAKYYSELYVERPETEESTWLDIFMRYVLPISGVVIGMGGAAVLTYLSAKKKKRNKEKDGQQI